MPPVRPLRETLDQRIEALHAEIEAMILDRIALEKAGAPGVPEQMIRDMFDAKYGVCACRVAKRMSDEAKKEADQVKAASA